jgi:hypothetical protein
MSTLVDGMPECPAAKEKLHTSIHTYIHTYIHVISPQLFSSGLHFHVKSKDLEFLKINNNQSY